MESVLVEDLLALFSEEMEYCDFDICKKFIKLTENMEVCQDSYL
jgi:hypothetical protein